MSFNQDGQSTVPPVALEAQLFHWEHGDGAQHFSANPITTDNGDITLVTMEQVEVHQPDDLKPSSPPYSGHSREVST